MSSTQTDLTAITLEISVDVPVEHAFAVFTQRFDEIKPRQHNMLAVPIAKTVLEPRVGGTIHDIGTDGSVCAWSRVLAYDPPHRIVFSWDITPRWQVETDPERASEVEVRFEEEGPERTKVVLVHRHLDRHGEGWQVFTALGDSGWPLYLERYRALTERG